MAAVSMVAFLAAGLVALDLAGFAASRAAVRTVAEGAALAASQELARIYETRPAGSGLSLSPGDKASVIEAALRYAASSTPPLRLAPNDVRFLRRGDGKEDRLESFVTPDTIEVLAGGGASAGGKVVALLASVLGSDALEPRVTGTAGLSPVSKVPEGAIGLPLGISAAWFEGRLPPCGKPAHVSLRSDSSPSGCLRWQVFSSIELGPASILSRIAEDRFLSPEAVAGATQWHVLAGAAEQGAFEGLLRLYDTRKDPSGRWEVLLPVHESTSCEEETGWRTVVGFASATIYRVSEEPSPGLDAEISCRILHLGQGGGRDYGTGTVVVLR